MTQPSPEDDLPSGPWKSQGGAIFCGTGRQIANAYGDSYAERCAIARAIAAIPERMEQINQLAAQLIEAEKYNAWHQQAVLEIERLRAENDLVREENRKRFGSRDGFDEAIIESFRKERDYLRGRVAELETLRKDNTELKAEIERWDETDPLVNKRLKEDLQEILTLRAEKALLVEECLSHAEIAESEYNFGFAQTLREIAALAKTRSNETETEAEG